MAAELTRLHEIYTTEPISQSYKKLIFNGGFLYNRGLTKICTLPPETSLARNLFRDVATGLGQFSGHSCCRVIQLFQAEKLKEWFWN